jgi:predicted GIY-YIG superfamily endonuclease
MKFAATGLADSFVYNPFEQKKISSDSVDVVRKIIEETTNRETVFVRSEWSPPASFEGTSCLYVLIMDEGQLLYVGESDSIAKRLKQHRRDKKKATAHALLVAIHEGKTEAREQETTIIRELASRGYNLLNTLK